MSNTCENKFRQYIKKQYPNAFIKKIPDFKQTGQSGAAGLPDYLVIDSGITDWYEVKKVSSSSRFPFKALSFSQWVVCKQLVAAGATVWIAAYMGGELKVFSFARLLKLYREDVSSVSISDLVS